MITESCRMMLGQLTELYDFLWPTSVALWNLRWQVAGFINAVPVSKSADLAARFSHGSGIHGANIRRSCVEITWEEQQEQFASFLLINIVALYEDWVSSYLQELGIFSEKLSADMQFFTSGSKGVHNVLNVMQSTISSDMAATVYACMSLSKSYAIVDVNSMLVCYRYFKELRNCIMHKGKISDARLVNSYALYTSQCTKKNLWAKEVPAAIPIQIGNRVAISLRGVVGFSGVVKTIIESFDIEASRTRYFEKKFIQNWQDKHPDIARFPNKEPKAESKIISFVKNKYNVSIKKPQAASLRRFLKVNV